MMPYLVTELSEKWYGLWLLVASITGFFALLTLGLSSAVQRFLSYEISSNSINEYKETISSSLFVFTVIGILAILLSIGIVFFTEYFVNEEELKSIFSLLIFVVGFNFAMRFFSTPFNAALTAEFYFSWVSCLEIFGFFIKSILTFYFVEEGYGVLGVGYALLIGEMFANISISFLAIFKLKNFRFSFSSISKKKIIGLYSYGVNAFLATLGVMLRFPLGNIVISSFIGLSAVTVYSIPVRLLGYADAFINTTLGVLQPYFTRLYAKGELALLRKQFFLSNTLSLGVGGMLAGGLFVFGTGFIDLWVTEYPQTQLLIYILPFTLLFDICQKPSVMVLYALNKHRYYAYLNIAEAIVNICIAFVLIQIIGLIGVALAVVIPMLFTKVWLLPRYVCKKLSVSSCRYYLLLVKAYSFVLIYSAIWTFIPVQIKGWLDFIILGLIYCVLYVILYSLLVLNVQQRKNIWSILYKKNRPNQT